ncbi:MAG: insulinase family protein [Clostridiales bacterium]|nr:insulinase family protein [Clostridiales bacterium]
MGLYIFPSTKFKTATISFYFRTPLERERVTVNSLLPLVMQRSTMKYGTTLELQRRLQELYGANFEVNVSKRGDWQITHICFEFVSERYTKNLGILREIVSLAADGIWGRSEFDSAYTAREKENLKSYIAAQINNKRAYAQRRLVEVMCEGTPYALNSDGYIEDIDAITPETLFAGYKDVFLQSPLEIFVMGDVDEEDARGLLEFEMSRAGISMLAGEGKTILANDMQGAGGALNSGNDSMTEAENVREVVERQGISQSKLAMGFVSEVKADVDEFYALTLYNAVFGGGPYSKLFNNVREKLSLAYYAAARLEPLKGLMLVNAGIDAANYKRAVEEILAQYNAVRDGDFTDDEFQSAKLSTVNFLEEMTDSMYAMSDFYLRQLLSGRGVEEKVSDIADKISNIRRDEITDVAQKVRHTATYFLTDDRAPM